MLNAMVTKDTDALVSAFEGMEFEEFKDHLDRCIEQGLWTPPPGPRPGMMNQAGGATSRN